MILRLNLLKKTFFFNRIGQPYLMYKEVSDSNEILEGNDALEGFSMDIIDNIAKMLNFSYKFMLTKNNKYGSYNKEKKSWDGLIKDILDRVLSACRLIIWIGNKCIILVEGSSCDM